MERGSTAAEVTRTWWAPPVHALCWAAVVVLTQLLAHRILLASGLALLPAGVLTTVVVALVAAALGVVDGVLFRSRVLLGVWAAALVVVALVSSALTLHAVLTSEDLAYQPRAELLAGVLPGTGIAAVVTLVVLGAAAAAGVGVGSRLGRKRRLRQA